jgi:hypothetical protein
VDRGTLSKEDFFANPSFDSLVLSEAQRQQAFLPILSGGMGLQSLHALADTAVLGGMASASRVALSPESFTDSAASRAVLEHLSLSTYNVGRVASLIRLLGTLSATEKERMSQILPEGWIHENAPGPDYSSIANSAYERGQHLAKTLSSAPPHSKCQNKLSQLLIAGRVERFDAQIARLPISEEESLRAFGETRARAQARVLSQRQRVHRCYSLRLFHSQTLLNP